MKALIDPTPIRLVEFLPANPQLRVPKCPPDRWRQISFTSPSQYSFRGVSPAVDPTPEGIALTLSRSTYYVSRWPSLKITYRTATGETRPVPQPLQPAIMEMLDNLRLGDDQAKRLAVYDLIKDLPTWIHVRLVPMHQFYWPGLITLAEFPAAIGLLESSPALVAALSSYFHRGLFTPEDHDTLARLVTGRQRDLLKWLGLGRTEAHCRIFRKLSEYDLDYFQWRQFGRRLGISELAEVVQKMPIIDRWVIKCLCLDEFSRLLTPQFLRELLVTKLQYHQLMDRGIRLEDVVDQVGLLRRCGVIHTRLNSVREFRVLQTHMDSLIADLPLCTGPEVGLAGLFAITSPRDLKAEGDIMQHCVGGASYVASALKGKCCFYRLYHPHRATISLQRSGPLGRWRLDVVKGPKNSKVPEEVRQLLRQQFLKADVLVPATF